MPLTNQKKTPGASWASKLFWSAKLPLHTRVLGKRRIALASFPRSGNTWVRNLIENAIHEKTGSATNDGVMPGKSHGSIIKTHFWDSHKYTRAIHLVRNPYDCFYSFYLWKQSYLGYNGTWEDSLKEDVVGWKSHSDHWIHSKKPTLIIKYEDLHADTFKNLKKILHWLGREVSDDLILKACEASEITNLKKNNPDHAKNHYREGKVGGGISHFSKNDLAFIEINLGNFLSQFGYT